MRKSRADRYSGAGALADDLKRFLAGEPILARPISAPERLVKWVLRRPATAALVGLCAASAFALATSWVWLVERERRYAQSSAARVMSQQHALGAAE